MLSKDLQYFSLCNNLDQTDTWAESQQPCGGKSPALQNQGDSSFRFYYATEKQKRQFRVGSASTFTVATKPKQPQYWWFKSSRQWRLNKQHQRCHNGATRCTSPWQNKLPSTLIPPTSICPPWCCQYCWECLWRRMSLYKPESIDRMTPFISSLIFGVWSNLDGTARPWPLIHGSFWGKSVPAPMNGPVFSSSSVCLFVPSVYLCLPYLSIAAIRRPFKKKK